jgi:hypothetical protein
VRRPLQQLKQLSTQLHDAIQWARVRNTDSAFALAHEQALAAVSALNVQRLKHILAATKPGASHYGNGPASDDLYGTLLLATATAIDRAQTNVNAAMAGTANSNNGLATYMAKKQAAAAAPLDAAADILNAFADSAFTAPMSAHLRDTWGSWIDQWKLEGVPAAALRRLLAAFDKCRRDGISTTSLDSHNGIRAVFATAKPVRRAPLDRAAILANLGLDKQSNNGKPRSDTATTASTSFSSEN